MEKILTICVLALLIVPVLTVTATENEVLESEIQTISAVKILTDQSLERDDKDNVTIVVSTGQAPNTPRIEGPISGIIGERYEYTITTMDPQGDDVYYKISWGDCAVIFWDGPYKSGEEVTYEHAWCEVCFPGGGEFTICVQATDDNGNHSNWGTLNVTMDKNKDCSSYNSLFQFFIKKLMERFPVLEKPLGF